MKISKQEYEELQRYRQNEQEDLERRQAERNRHDQWLIDHVADIHRRSDNGEVFSLSD